MQMIQKLPLNVPAIANLMRMTDDEVRCWYHLKEIRQLFRDYNYGVLSKSGIIQKLQNITGNCSNEKNYPYSDGVNHLIKNIELRY